MDSRIHPRLILRHIFSANRNFEKLAKSLSTASLVCYDRLCTVPTEFCRFSLNSVPRDSSLSARETGPLARSILRTEFRLMRPTKWFDAGLFLQNCTFEWARDRFPTRVRGRGNVCPKAGLSRSAQAFKRARERQNIKGQTDGRARSLEKAKGFPLFGRLPELFLPPAPSGILTPRSGSHFYKTQTFRDSSHSAQHDSNAIWGN